ncbi:MAG: Rpn family recombination-promoting nuclease/putative transposase [Gammaproteobacteria bacterium]|nr:Rpn family recombination-promoting nuclease/putative transposase [Gammaproteobacteria bacterium]
MPPPAAASVPTAAQPHRPLLDPCNDFVFKTLFVQKPALLLDLVNAVRRHMPPVEDIEILNPAIPPEAIQGKAIVLDLLARDRIGQRFNVEMQVQRQPTLPKRSVFYLARVTSGVLEAGEQYVSLAPVIGIHLLDFVYFPDRPGKACWRYILRDDELGDVLPDSPLELNLVELPKGDGLGENDRNDSLAAWITFFKHAREPDIMSQIESSPVREAMNTLRGISDDELNQLHALARKRALMDQAALVDEARTEGLTEGAINMLIRLLTARFGPLPEATVERLRAGTAEDHDRWAVHLLTAASLDEVFLPPGDA